MEIQINPKDFGGTEFLARPSQLHLGAQNAVGVDRLTFRLPAAWKDLAVTFHVRHSDGSLAAPLLLDSSGSVPVSRKPLPSYRRRAPALSARTSRRSRVQPATAAARRPSWQCSAARGRARARWCTAS